MLPILLACAALPLDGRPVDWTAQVRVGEFVDLRGVVHVHTRSSFDSPGRIADVAAAAAKLGVSWVALSEHPSSGAPPFRGELRGVTLIPGYELELLGGSLLALGIDAPPQEQADPAALVREIHALGGVAFVSHFERSALADPARYVALAPDGVEIVNLHATALQQRLGLTLRALFLPGPRALELLVQTPRENLARWSALSSAQAIVGGVDAHARFRLLGSLAGAIDSYGRMFRLLTTHVLARDSSEDAILEALRAGRSYVAFESLGRVDHFGFQRSAAGFELSPPRAARLVLVCDGLEVAASHGEHAEFSAPTGARWCRAEAWQGDRLWVVTSRQPVGLRQQKGEAAGELP